MKNDNNNLVVGATGMLGTEVVNHLRKQGRLVSQAVWPPTNDPQYHILDITDIEAVEKLISSLKPAVVYNCSAFTDVDGAEKMEETATRVNGTGVDNLAKICRNHNATLVHVSTDYVFDGRSQSPYTPEVQPQPRTAYGRSKLAGEKAIQASGLKDWIIVRTSWLFGRAGKNFIDTITALAAERDELKVVNDQIGCPTYAPDLARCLVELSDKAARGIFHFCNPPACSWFDFAAKAVEIARLDCRIKPCGTSEFPRPAPRPAYSVLDCTRTFEILGWLAPSWQECLARHLQGT